MLTTCQAFAARQWRRLLRTAREFQIAEDLRVKGGSLAPGDAMQSGARMPPAYLEVLESRTE